MLDEIKRDVSGVFPRVSISLSDRCSEDRVSEEIAIQEHHELLPHEA
jgi:hypothetical protein